MGRARDGLDIWEQEVEEAIQAMSEPTQDGAKCNSATAWSSKKPGKTLTLQDISLTMDTPSSSMGIPGQFLQVRWCEVCKLVSTV